MSKSEAIHKEYDVEVLNSPFSRVYLCPETELIIHCTMGFKYPINVDALKKAFSNSIMIKHTRFCSLMVRNCNGQDQWKKTQVNIDDHFIIHHPTTDLLDVNDVDGETFINSYLSEVAVSSPLNPNKPLWEVHVFLGLKCIVFRVHHSIGDGASLMSMLSTCFGKKRESTNNNVVNNNGDYYNVKKNNYSKKKRKNWVIWVFIMSLWYSIVFGLRLLWRFLWVKDEITIISGGDGVELWPRKMVTVKFNIEEFKSIKLAIPNVTVNDVLLGIVSCGLSKYIDAKSPEAMLQIIQLTAILMVNLRDNRSSKSQSIDLMKVSSRGGFPSWGNKTGLVLLPLSCRNGLYALDHVRALKAIMDQKKNSFEAHITYWSLKLFSLIFGPKVASQSCQRILCNTSLLISNFMGPSQEIEFADNPVSYIRVNCSSQPHAITMHMVSYAGMAELQLMVAKDIITDPEFLAKCFQDSLLEMKNSIKRDPTL